jgi:para-nitrobenzyl esterase
MLARRGPTYAYEFADADAPWFAGTPTPGYPTGAYHAGELQYLFSGAYAGGALSPAQQELSDRMIGYWTRFAHSGDPNGEGLPAWPRFGAPGEHVQSLGTDPGGIGPVDLEGEHRCGFWASVTGRK